MTFLYDTIDNTTLTTLLSQPDVILLDVRSVEEYEQLGHVPNAVLFPMDQIPVRLGELPKDQPLVVMCQLSRLSAMAAAPSSPDAAPTLAAQAAPGCGHSKRAPVVSVRVIEDCLEDCVFVTSATVRQMIRDGDPAWRSFVPDIVLQKGLWAA